MKETELPGSVTESLGASAQIAWTLPSATTSTPKNAVIPWEELSSGWTVEETGRVNIKLELDPYLSPLSHSRARLASFLVPSRFDVFPSFMSLSFSAADVEWLLPTEEVHASP